MLFRSCGALRFHLNDQSAGLNDMRGLIDRWWPEIERGAEAIVMTASGCGSTVKEFGYLLAGDPAYAEKAARISAMMRDISEVVASELAKPGASETLDLASIHIEKDERVAFHPPCSLQHGQKIRGVIEGVLRNAGVVLQPVADAHLCCGSPGTYSILQPDLEIGRAHV